MCPLCPKCNDDGSNCPCQDQFGSNARPLGGALGLCHGGGGAVEFQKQTTPHFHGNVLLSSVYRFKTLKEIGQLIEKDLLSVDAITCLILPRQHVVRHVNTACHIALTGIVGRFIELGNSHVRNMFSVKLVVGCFAPARLG